MPSVTAVWYRTSGRAMLAPTAIAVSVDDGIQQCAQASCGIIILLPGQDIARIIVCPHPGSVRSLIVLPNQLVGSIIDVCVFVGPALYPCNITVIIIGIVKINDEIRRIRLVICNLARCGSALGAGKEEILRYASRTAISRGNVIDSSEVIVIISYVRISIEPGIINNCVLSAYAYSESNLQYGEGIFFTKRPKLLAI